MHALTLLAIFPLAAYATLNGHCSGSAATGAWKESGICIKTSTCRSYGGAYKSGACPNDPDDVKCCLVGLEGSFDTNPCGYPSYCTWTNDAGCVGSFSSGHCPGGSNYQCCK